MASEIKLWQLHEGKLQDVNDSFAAEHLEKDLEDLIEKNSTLLGDDLLVIGRQGALLHGSGRRWNSPFPKR